MESEEILETVQTPQEHQQIKVQNFPKVHFSDYKQSQHTTGDTDVSVFLRPPWLYIGGDRTSLTLIQAVLHSQFPFPAKDMPSSVRFSVENHLSQVQKCLQHPYRKQFSCIISISPSFTHSLPSSFFSTNICFHILLRIY